MAEKRSGSAATVDRLAMLAEGSYVAQTQVEPGECAFIAGQYRGYIVMRTGMAPDVRVAWPLTPRRMVGLAIDLLRAAWRIKRGRGRRQKMGSNRHA